MHKPLPVPDEFFEGPYGAERRRMLTEHLWGRDVRDERVLRAMARVPRHAFIDPELAGAAYEDKPLAIGHNQTISQPYMVARMSELARLNEGDRVLEIGVGSGYQTAVLLELGARVYGLEIHEPLAREAEERLRALGYANFEIYHRDGSGGLPERAPFAAILVAAAPEEVPAPLLDQLAPGGRLVIPAGPLEDQHLYVYTRTPEGVQREIIFPVRFVPMIGSNRESHE